MASMQKRGSVDEGLSHQTGRPTARCYRSSSEPEVIENSKESGKVDLKEELTFRELKFLETYLKCGLPIYNAMKSACYDNLERERGATQLIKFSKSMCSRRERVGL
jgi:hypothetical protein